MQAGSELSEGLGPPTRLKPPEHTTHLNSGAIERERKAMLPNPKEKTWSYCAKVKERNSKQPNDGRKPWADW